jgi:hypothetical protein
VNDWFNHQVSVFASTQGKQLKPKGIQLLQSVGSAILTHTCIVLPKDKLVHASLNVEPVPTIYELNGIAGVVGVGVGVPVLVGVGLGVVVVVGVFVGVSLGVDVFVGVTVGVVVGVVVLVGVGVGVTDVGVGVGVTGS